MALWMNAMFLKVLKEVQLGLPITELNVKRGIGGLEEGNTNVRCHAQSS